MNKDLNIVSKEIRDIITQKQKEMNLTFVEDTHTYYIKNKDGDIVTNYPSVSTVIGQFYEPFPDQEKSFDKAKGNLIKQDEILREWRESGSYSTNMGSRVHYILEKNLLEQYSSYKEVRMPIFECDEEQTKSGDNMIEAGMGFIDLMHERGAVLLDTEMVLGSVDLGYTGQPDKVWLMFNKKGEIGIVITDWKTNKPKNFEVQWYTKKMLKPFGEYHDTSLGHYNVQLPLYGRLLMDMLKGTKYEDIRFFGCVVVHLGVNGELTEYKVPKKIIDTVFTMDPLPRIEHVKEYKVLQEYKENERLRKLELIKK